jgi:hypothetical protein
MDVAHHQCHSFFFMTVAGCGTGCRRIMPELALKAHNPKRAPTRREIGFGHFAEGKIRAHASIIEGGNILFMALSDTSPEVEAMQSRIHERMTGEQRLLMALEMSYFAHELAKQGLRDTHPDWPEERVRREFLRSLFPPGTAPAGL